MKVRILKSNNPHSWQNNFIGKVVTVDKIISSTFKQYQLVLDLTIGENKHIRESKLIQSNWKKLFVDPNAYEHL